MKKMQLNIYTCDCLLDHFVLMTTEEILSYVSSHELFSLTDSWLMFLNSGNDIIFFCLSTLRIVKPFINERIFCLKRTSLWDDTCLDFIQFDGVHNCCQNCLYLLTINLKKSLIKIKK